MIFQTRAQRNAHLLPIIRAWHSVNYTHVTTVRTFNVYAQCANGAAL